jgi:hypothetical protein
MNSHTRKLGLVEIPLSIRQQMKRDKLKMEILTEVRKFISFCNDPKNTKLLTTLGIMIESLVKKSYNIDKLSLFLEILTLLFPNITEKDVEFAKSHIEAELIECKIKGIPVLRNALSYTFEIVFKKVIKLLI